MTESLKHRSVNLLKPTLIFSAIGLFIPGFTAIGILAFQRLLTSFGLACPNAWTALWSFTIIGGLILPILFYRYLKTVTVNKLENLSSRLTFFNLIEYTFLQASLVPYFTSGPTLCFDSDGQNGLELVFTAWIALPILIGLSALFNQTLKSQNE